MTKKTIKRGFTLIEMMIALTILSFIGAFTGMQIKKLIDTHRFESQVTELFIALQEAQVLSAAYHTDFALDITVKDGSAFYHFTTNEPLPTWKFNDHLTSLPQTAHIKFNDKKINTFHFDIYAGGRIEPRGILIFSQTPDGKTLWFDMQYGQLLKYCHVKPPLENLQIPTLPKL